MTIYVPFTEEQVEQLNRYQRSGVMHPFTCGTRDEHPGNPGVLIATTAGWRCPACDYHQGWAHAFMADKDALDRMEKMMGSR